MAPPGMARLGQAASLPLAALDRPDALLAIFQALPVPRAASLLASAQLVLGEILRDVELLLSARRPTAPAEAHVRRSLLVAAGLLGTAIPFSEAVEDPGSADDTSAWALSVVLANPEGAVAELADGVRLASGEAGRILDFALMIIRAGFPFSVIG